MKYAYKNIYNSDILISPKYLSKVVLGMRLELIWVIPQVFETCASTTSASPAALLIYK